jgi:hypothetical protein
MPNLAKRVIFSVHLFGRFNKSSLSSRVSAIGQDHLGLFPADDTYIPYALQAQLHPLHIVTHILQDRNNVSTRCNWDRVCVTVDDIDLKSD